KEINKAYEVLGDPDKRKKYDEFGADWRNGGFRLPPGGGGARTYSWRSGEGAAGVEFGGTGFSDFLGQFFGGRGGFHRGGGGYAETQTERGQDVEGVIMVTLEEATNGSVRSVSVRRNGACPECGGTGIKGRKECPRCEGSGQVQVSHSYQVRIPAGVRDGQRLRLAGRGEPGHGGGPAGDLYLRVRFASHPDFRVEGGDLYHDLELAPWEAALGTNVAAPTLTGPVNIKIPSGAQNGQRLRVRGKGLAGPGGAAGDLYVVVRVQMPKEITPQARALWEQLAR